MFCGALGLRRPVYCGDAATSWEITFQLTRFAFIQPFNETSNQTDPIWKQFVQKLPDISLPRPNLSSLYVEQNTQVQLQQAACGVK